MTFQIPNSKYLKFQIFPPSSLVIRHPNFALPSYDAPPISSPPLRIPTAAKSIALRRRSSLRSESSVDKSSWCPFTTSCLRDPSFGLRFCGTLALLFLLTSLLTACATPPGVIFPPLADAPRWPPPPDQPRITYVGQLRTDQDLKPGVNGFDNLGQALFGKNDAHSVLSPLALCTDGHDRLFVADSNAQLVHVFNFNTRAYATWTPGKKQPAFAQPVAVAWDPIHQHLLVSDSVAAAVLVFDTTGNYLGHLGGAEADKIFQRPVGIAIDNTPAHAGRIFVADAKLHQLLVFSPDGLLTSRVGQRGDGPGEFNFPTYLAIDPDGTLYVSDSLNFRIQQFDPELHFLRQIGKKGDMPGYFAQPKGVATDSQGHLYVVDSQFENVQVYNNQGQVLMDLGQEGTAPGQFWLPAGICIAPLPPGAPPAPSIAGAPPAQQLGNAGVPPAGQSGNAAIPPAKATDRIYVADSYNRRIQVFDYQPLPEDAP